MSLVNPDSDIEFSMRNGKRLKIRCSAYEHLKTFRQVRKASNESGGILLGRIFAKSGVYIIDEITTPKKSDRQSRYTFFRSKSHHDIALKSWQDSDGQCLYLGLWHSHPESNPTPSKVDYSDWRNAMKKGQYEGYSLLFLIVGMTNLGCWQGVYRKGGAPRFYQLERAD